MDIKVQFIAPTHWWKRATWKLLEDYTSHNGAVDVPAGFITDGATIPLLFRWIFSPTGKYFGAAIVHDYLIAVKNDWPRANDELEKEMKALNVGTIRRRLILASVTGYFNVVHFLFKR